MVLAILSTLDLASHLVIFYASSPKLARETADLSSFSHRTSSTSIHLSTTKSSKLDPRFTSKVSRLSTSSYQESFAHFIRATRKPWNLIFAGKLRKQSSHLCCPWNHTFARYTSAHQYGASTKEKNEVFHVRSQSPSQRRKPNVDARESFTAEPLKVIVGPVKKAFYINKEVICAESEFFKAACKDIWSSGRENIVTLAEDDPEIFGIFLVWLSTRDLGDAQGLLTNCALKSPVYENENVGEDKEKERIEQLKERLAEVKAQSTQLLQCFVLGDSIQCAKFRNCVMDQLYMLSDAFQSSSIVGLLAGSAKLTRLIFTSTLKGSPLRGFCLDHFLSPGMLSLTKEHMKQWITSDHLCIMEDLLPRILAENPQDEYPLEFPWRFPWEHEKNRYHDATCSNEHEWAGCTNTTTSAVVLASSRWNVGWGRVFFESNHDR